jgi:hypothetical protein
MSYAAGADSRVDWNGIRDYFVYETPADMTLKKFTEDVLSTIPEASGAFLSYRDVRDKAYKGKWMELRARYLIEKFPGLYTDAEIQYGMLMERFISKYSDLTTRDLSNLTNVIQSLRDALLNRDSSVLEQAEEDVDYLTRDNVLEMINEMVVLDKRKMAEVADSQLEEHMLRIRAEKSDNGAGGAVEDQ